MDNHEYSILQHRIAVSDDQQAFLLLHKYFQPRLFRFAKAIVHNREDAEEVVEDVFVRIWQKRKTLDHVQNLRLYLYTATRNFALNYIRAQKGSEQLNIDDLKFELQTGLPNPQEAAEHSEIRQIINKATLEMPQRCKVIFKLVKEDGLKQKEVADLLHINIKTVENQLAIAIKRLALAISEVAPQNSKSNATAGG